MSEKISRSTLSMAAEFAVASELGRRNIYAQPTFGNQKRTDLLIFGIENNLLKIEVKGKQGKDWPNCKGICGKNVFIVFVDFAGKGEFERPDFYVLSDQDWIDFVEQERIRAKEKGVIIERGECNVPIFPKQVKNGKTYQGIGVTPNLIKDHKEKWEKIRLALEIEYGNGDHNEQS